MTELTNIQRKLVMVALMRGNSSLPPSCRWGKSNRRLNMAIMVAKTATETPEGQPRDWPEVIDWAATVVLDCGKVDPLWADLAERVTSAILADTLPGDRQVAAWFHLYIDDLSGELRPKGWEERMPIHAVYDGIIELDVTHEGDRILEALAQITGEFSAQPSIVHNTLTLKGAPLGASTLRILKKLGSARAGHHVSPDGTIYTPLRDIPEPYYRNGWDPVPYGERKDLPLLVSMVAAIHRGDMGAAIKLAHKMGQKAYHSWWSGYIEGIGFVGSSRRCEARPREVAITLAPWADDFDPVIQTKIRDAIINGVAGYGIPRQACRDALLPLACKATN